MNRKFFEECVSNIDYSKGRCSVILIDIISDFPHNAINLIQIKDILEKQNVEFSDNDRSVPLSECCILICMVHNFIYGWKREGGKYSKKYINDIIEKRKEKDDRILLKTTDVELLRWYDETVS